MLTKKQKIKAIVGWAVILFGLILLLTACDGRSIHDKQPKYIEGVSKNSWGYDIRYIKDTRTNLCFAERGMGETYTFTCVPCDSIHELFFQLITED